MNFGLSSLLLSASQGNPWNFLTLQLTLGLFFLQIFQVFLKSDFEIIEILYYWIVVFLHFFNHFRSLGIQKLKNFLILIFGLVFTNWILSVLDFTNEINQTLRMVIELKKISLHFFFLSEQILYLLLHFFEMTIRVSLYEFKILIKLL